MPKRGSRGGSRGGSRRRGGGSNGGRIFHKKTKSRGRNRSNGNGNTALPNVDVPELMDLQENSFVPSTSSMRYNSKRPGRRMVDEIEYTDAHHDETMNKPLRMRPLEFVKAKEVYDPAAELFKRKSKGEKQELLDILKSNVNESGDESDLSHISGDDEMEVDVVEKGLQEEEDDELEMEMELVEEDSKDEEEDEIIIPKVEDSRLESSITLEDLNIKELPKEVDELSFILDDEADEDLEEYPRQSIAALLRKRFIKSELEFSVESPEIDSPIEENGVEYDPVLTIGKVSLNTSKDEFNNTTTKLMTLQGLKRSTQTGFVDENDEVDFESDIELDKTKPGYHDYVQQIIQGLRDNSDYEDNDDYESDTNFDIMASSDEEQDQEETPEEGDEPEAEPEYGFLPEDFEFDVSKVSITNVRFGIKNQFYVKSYELTGTDEYMWMDEDEVIEYITLNGVKEHRIHSFLKFATGGLIEDKPPVNDDYSDVYISESSDDEEIDDDVLDEDEDNLNELLEFAKGLSKSFLGTDKMVPTESIQTKGKGRKKVLDLDKHDLDTEIFQSLQNQYQIHRERKKAKRNAKDEARQAEAMRKHDLLVKYPYTLHIKDIRNEFELFLHDSLRESMSFPPLDPHGSKTLMKMSKCYNMKAMRCGPNGIKLFIKVAKYKGTYHYLPKYNEISHMLKQRPIFNRTDQKRPKDEYIATDGNAKKERGRSKPLKAHMREGDIVGDKAPEIGHDNIGRQLLVKLGWKVGEGLGSTNQGINTPIQATIKMSKVGLK